MFLFNPISAGVLENQDTMGVGQFDPLPSESHICITKMKNNIIAWK